ncbi:MAG: hypothetical protein IPP33_04820 [Flavobacteriales bacterium]|nr:hypothetical protein [Flavobacteriales bacterium]
MKIIWHECISASPLLPMRFTAHVLLLALLASVFAPAIIVGEFLVDRDRITRELCVQRLVPEEMRTCHGNCYLSKTLRKVDQQERTLPDELRSMRLPEVVITGYPLQLSASGFQCSLTAIPEQCATCDGWAFASDPVPWC